MKFRLSLFRLFTDVVGSICHFYQAQKRYISDRTFALHRFVSRETRVVSDTQVRRHRPDGS